MFETKLKKIIIAVMNFIDMHAVATETMKVSLKLEPSINIK